MIRQRTPCRFLYTRNNEIGQAATLELGGALDEALLRRCDAGFEALDAGSLAKGCGHFSNVRRIAGSGKSDGRNFCNGHKPADFPVPDLKIAEEIACCCCRRWLKTLRKKNASVVFATQSLADIETSSIAPAIIES